MKNLIQNVFVKSHEYGIEMVQSIYFQYTIKCFIKFDNRLNGFSNIFALCNIFL